MDFSLKALGEATSVNDRLAEQRHEPPVELTCEIVRQAGHEVDPVNLDDLADQRGLRLALAATGRYDELKRLHDEGPDFVRLDANEQIIKELGKMSFLDGFAACSRLFLVAQEGELPIVFVYTVDGTAIKATFNGPRAHEDAQRFMQANPGREWGLDVSDDRCPHCNHHMSSEAWVPEGNGSGPNERWHCPHCGEVDPRSDKERPHAA